MTTNPAPIVLGLMALAVPTARLRAQLDTATASRIRDSYRIRLELTSRERFDARFQALEPSVLVVQSIVRPTFEESYFVERRVELDSLSRIWILEGTQSRNLAITGGIAFGSLGLVLGAAFRDYSDGPADDRCALVVCMGTGALGGAMLGALAGGVLGALLPRWRVLWPGRQS